MGIIVTTPKSQMAYATIALTYRPGKTYCPGGQNGDE